MKRYFFIALSLILVGVLLAIFGKALLTNNNEKDLFQKYQQTLTLYEGIARLEGEARLEVLNEVQENFSSIALGAQSKQLAATAFYNLGTICLKEFWKDGENISNLEKAILYLQESLRRDPTLERARRNLERAWREAEERGLMDEFSLLDKSAGEDQYQAEGEGEGGGEIKEDQEHGGTESTDEPLPFSEEEGHGRGKEERDY